MKQALLPSWQVIVTAGEYGMLLLYRKLDFLHEECQIDSWLFCWQFDWSRFGWQAHPSTTRALYRQLITASWQETLPNGKGGGMTAKLWLRDTALDFLLKLSRWELNLRPTSFTSLWSFWLASSDLANSLLAVVSCSSISPTCTWETRLRR